MSENASVTIEFSPNFKLLPLIRRFVTSFYREISVPDDLSEGLGVASHELLENAVKYASEPRTQLAVSVEYPDDGPAQLVVATRNRATPERLALVEAKLSEMASIRDPRSYYLELMQSVSDSPKTSGLGLARILAEVGMTLSYHIDGDEIEIRGVLEFQR